MLIVLPPSETKAAGGTRGPLDLTRLAFPELTATRAELIEELSALDVPTGLSVLGLSERMAGEVAANQRLTSAPTMPATERYTGVLFDALAALDLPAQARARLGVSSALFGLLGAEDLIPHYRLSAGTKLNGATLKSRWGKQITQALSSVEGLVVDLRSGAYQALGRFAPAVTVRVETAEGKVVSHFNKKYKGQLARILALSSDEPDDAAGVARIARAGGLDARVSEPRVPRRASARSLEQGGEVILTV